MLRKIYYFMLYLLAGIEGFPTESLPLDELGVREMRFSFEDSF
jgi:hypothetical protein